MHYSPWSEPAANAARLIQFERHGRRYMAINGGPGSDSRLQSRWLPTCDTQAELDHLWDSLSEGGATMACGWLTDRFGVSSQIDLAFHPPELMASDEEKSNRVMQALWCMVKLDIGVLQQAAEA